MVVLWSKLIFERNWFVLLLC